MCEADASLNSDIDVSVVQSDDTVLLTAKPYNGTKMRVWDITQGEPQPDMVCTVNSILAVTSIVFYSCCI